MAYWGEFGDSLAGHRAETGYLKLGTDARPKACRAGGSSGTGSQRPAEPEVRERRIKLGLPRSKRESHERKCSARERFSRQFGRDFFVKLEVELLGAAEISSRVSSFQFLVSNLPLSGTMEPWHEWGY